MTKEKNIMNSADEPIELTLTKNIVVGIVCSCIYNHEGFNDG